jgi:hypothetical protein
MSRWVKIRKPSGDYPETEHQKQVGVAGKVISKVCKGKKKVEFRACRHEVMQCVFHGDNSNIEIVEAKKEVENKG